MINMQTNKGKNKQQIYLTYYWDKFKNIYIIINEWTRK